MLNLGTEIMILAIKALFMSTPMVEFTLDDEAIINIRDNGMSAIVVESMLINKFVALKQLLNDYYYFIRRDSIQMIEIRKIAEEFNKCKIKHIFLKGAVIRSIYPSSFLRGMGDIDVFILKEQLKMANLILTDLGFINSSTTPNAVSFHKGKDLIVDLHLRLDSVFEDRFSGLFGEEWNYAYLIEQSTYRFNPEFELAYLIYHLAKHFRNSGIGIRSILDIGVYINHYKDSFSVNQFIEYLHKANLNLFASYLLNFQERYFGFEFQKLIQHLPLIDPEVLDDILDWVVSTGVHGKSKEYNVNVSNIATQSIQGNAKSYTQLRYIFIRVFPPRKLMLIRYPFLSKFGVLLPICWLLRGVNLLFRNPKHSINQFKSLFVDKNTMEYARNLFDEIGL